MKDVGKKRKGRSVKSSEKRPKRTKSPSVEENQLQVSADVDQQHGHDLPPSTNESKFDLGVGLRRRSKNPSEHENVENQQQSHETKSKSSSILHHTESYHRQDSPHPIAAHHSVLPLSMQMMRPFWRFCEKCAPPRPHADYNFESTLNTVLPIDDAATATATANGRIYSHFESTPSFIGKDGKVTNLTSASTEKESEVEDTSIHSTDIVINHSNHLELIPPTPKDHTLSLLQEYRTATQMYGCAQINPGVMTAIRFSLPTLRVSGSFHDSDMLALCEVLFRHCNGALHHIQRLDFSIAGRFGKLHGRKGFGSHGAFTLSRVLCISNHIEEVILRRNKIGPYGASAIFAAASKNSTLKNISLRRCHIGEKGALAFVEYVKGNDMCGLREVDLSVNGIGFKGSITIEEMLIEREKDGIPINIDLDGNLVIQEIMNGVTHGLGIILCILGMILMSKRVRGQGLNKEIACGVYSASLMILYLSSTLFHSFFALKYTRFIFQCLDHCAIYILITGSYTPFLRIALINDIIASRYLLAFQWLCCLGGIFVEIFHNSWQYKGKFTLAMYLGMGWSCALCFPSFMQVLPKEAIRLIVLGGVAYTGGVPFFVRNNNLDHSIWHCFVMAGSLLHWLAVYIYVTPL